MNWRVDARVPVVVAQVLAETLPELAGAAVLAEGALPEALPDGVPRAVFTLREGAPHTAACLCCQGQGAAAAALAGLFRARATGGPWFDRVVAVVRTAEGRAEVEGALARDILTLARYRPA
jgi:hypothetical protein